MCGQISAGGGPRDGGERAPKACFASHHDYRRAGCVSGLSQSFGMMGGEPGFVAPVLLIVMCDDESGFTATTDEDEPRGDSVSDTAHIQHGGDNLLVYSPTRGGRAARPRPARQARWRRRAYAPPRRAPCRRGPLDRAAAAGRRGGLPAAAGRPKGGAPRRAAGARAPPRARAPRASGVGGFSTLSRADARPRPPPRARAPHRCARPACCATIL